jgi:hypothetical protein
MRNDVDGYGDFCFYFRGSVSPLSWHGIPLFNVVGESSIREEETLVANSGDVTSKDKLLGIF